MGSESQKKIFSSENFKLYNDKFKKPIPAGKQALRLAKPCPVAQQLSNRR